MVTGTCAIEHAKKAGKVVAKQIQMVGYAVRFANFRVENMLGVMDMKFPIRLEGVAYENRDVAQYEPEMFPGLVWRFWSAQITCLIFVSGKVIITGCRNLEDMEYAGDYLYPNLYKYQR